MDQMMSSSGNPAYPASRCFNDLDKFFSRFTPLEMSLRQQAQLSPQPRLPSQLSMQPSQLSMQPSQMSMQPSQMSMQPSQLSMQPSQLSMQPSQMSMQPSQLSMQPSQLSMQPSQLSMQSSQLSMQPSQMSMQSSQLSMQSSQLSMQSSQLSMQPSQMSMQSSQLSMQSSQLSMQPSQPFCRATYQSPAEYMAAKRAKLVKPETKQNQLVHPYRMAQPRYASPYEMNQTVKSAGHEDESLIAVAVKNGWLLQKFYLPHDQYLVRQKFHISMDLFQILNSSHQYDVFFKSYQELGLIHWPRGLRISVNGVPINTWDHQKPVSVKNMCKPGDNFLDFAYPKCVCDHFFVLNVVKMASMQAVKSGILQFQIYDAAICIKKYQASMLHSSDKHSMMSNPGVLSQMISLICPICRKRMIIPARGNMCRHIQCFNLESLLQLYCNRDFWKCPICDNDLALDKLEVDQYILSVLKELAGKACDSIVISSTGQWKPIPRSIHGDRDSILLPYQNPMVHRRSTLFTRNDAPGTPGASVFQQTSNLDSLISASDMVPTSRMSGHASEQTLSIGSTAPPFAAGSRNPMEQLFSVLSSRQKACSASPSPPCLIRPNSVPNGGVKRLRKDRGGQVHKQRLADTMPSLVPSFENCQGSSSPNDVLRIPPGSCIPAPESCRLAPRSCGPALGSCGPAPRSCGPAPGSCSPAPLSCGPAPGSCEPATLSCGPSPGSCGPAPLSCGPPPGSCGPATGNSTPVPGNFTPASFDSGFPDNFLSPVVNSVGDVNSNNQAAKVDTTPQSSNSQDTSKFSTQPSDAAFADALAVLQEAASEGTERRTSLEVDFTTSFDDITSMSPDDLDHLLNGQ